MRSAKYREIEFNYCKTEDEVANIFTKALQQVNFETL